jgi:hypothetical protein
MAIAGRAPRPGLESLHRADDAAQLSAAVNQVVDSISLSPCELEFDAAPERPGLLELDIDGTAYTEVLDCGSEDGFVYTSDAFESVRLCGVTCSAADAAVAVTLGCP